MVRGDDGRGVGWTCAYGGEPVVDGGGTLCSISSTIEVKFRGHRVSVFQFDKDWNVVGGKNLVILQR